MKKYLVAGAAGLALAIPTSALADEMEDMGGVSISGYMNHDFGFGSYVGGEMAADDFHQEIDAELTFKATGTTDGGLTVTATMEVDADSGAGVDESNLAIGGGFGTIILGAQDNAANRHGNKGTGGGYGGGGYYDCGWGNFTPATCPSPVPNSDALGIQFDTPNIGGMQAGISFQPEDGHEGPTTTANDMNVIAVGANFSGDFAGTALTLGANHVTKKSGGANSDSIKSWGLGAAATFGGTTLSVRYDMKAEQSVNAVPGAKMGDITGFGVGVDHTIGALTFGIGYGSMTEENAAYIEDVDANSYTYTAQVPADSTNFVPAIPAMAGIVPTNAQDVKHTMISAGGTYDLGGGVKISAGIHHGKVTNQAVGDMASICVVDGATADDGIGELGTGNGALDADGTCNDSDTAPLMATYTQLNDLDDVGVGLRIAFSF